MAACTLARKDTGAQVGVHPNRKIGPVMDFGCQACDQVTGKDTVIGAFNGYTDTAVIAGALGNHNCMSYGPGSLELAHKPNEYVPYEDVSRCRRVLWRLVEQVVF